MEQNNVTNNNKIKVNASDDTLKQQLVNKFVVAGLTREDATLRASKVLENIENMSTKTNVTTDHISLQETKENTLISNQVIQKAMERNMISPNLELTARAVLEHSFEDSHGKDIRSRTQIALEALNGYIELSRKIDEKKASRIVEIKKNSVNPFASLQKQTPSIKESDNSMYQVTKDSKKTSSVKSMNAVVPPTAPPMKQRSTTRTDTNISNNEEPAATQETTFSVQPISAEVIKKEDSLKLKSEMLRNDTQIQSVVEKNIVNPVQTNILKHTASIDDKIKEIEAVVEKLNVNTGNLSESVIHKKVKNSIGEISQQSSDMKQPVAVPNKETNVQNSNISLNTNVKMQQKQKSSPSTPITQETKGLASKVLNVASKDTEFFAKYVSEQVDIVTAVISHNDQLPPDMVEGIKESLLKTANAISTESGVSVSNRIQKLDALFSQYKNEYATGSIADHIPTDNTISELLTLSETEVNTGNNDNDARFKETLNNALQNKVRQMKDMKIAVSEIHTALKEEYEVIKKFYLMSSSNV